MSRTVIVVPCYNEEHRWNADYWSAIAQPGRVELAFVNDGSTDRTGELIDAAVDGGIGSALTLDRNSGKAEAVRRGLLAALDAGSPPAVVGFLDADGAFPAGEVIRLTDLATEMVRPGADYESLWSARVMMAGRSISRRSTRHYLGRVIATVIAPMHGYDVYDTQSGFKLFKVSETLLACLAEPFQTKWFADVEILQRWSRREARPLRIWEEPVVGWHDVHGSNMNSSQYAQVAKDLSRLYRGRVTR